MEVNLSTKLNPVNPSQPQRITSPRPAVAASDSTSFEGAAALNRSLRASPEVRPEAVQRAQQLIQNTAYPTAQVLQRVAGLLGAHLDPADLS
jgi:hypothetical protein